MYPPLPFDMLADYGVISVGAWWCSPTQTSVCLLSPKAAPVHDSSTDSAVTWPPIPWLVRCKSEYGLCLPNPMLQMKPRADGQGRKRKRTLPQCSLCQRSCDWNLCSNRMPLLWFPVLRRQHTMNCCMLHSDPRVDWQESHQLVLHRCYSLADNRSQYEQRMLFDDEVTILPFS